MRSGGTLDTSRSKNISIVPGHPDDGTYCLIVPPTARNLSVVGDLSDGASNDTIFASLDPTTVASYCVAGARNAVVYNVDNSGTPHNHDFMIVVD